MPIPIKIQQSRNILSGTTLTSLKIKVIFTGTIRVFVSQDKSTWSEIAPTGIVTDTYYIKTFTSSSTALYWRIVGLTGSKVYSTASEPGIYIEKLS